MDLFRAYPVAVIIVVPYFGAADIRGLHIGILDGYLGIVVAVRFFNRAGCLAVRYQFSVYIDGIIFTAFFRFGHGIAGSFRKAFNR